MKNAIKYFYNIEPLNITFKNNYYFFFYNNNQYCIYNYTQNINNINEIYNQNLYLLYNKIPVHKIILNKNNLPISTINNKHYILYKINIKDINKKISLQSINKLNSIRILTQNININWANNWIDRIDYTEYQINQMGKKYPLLVESFNYYVGLSENAISYLNNVKNDYNQYSFSHKKLTINSTLFDLYDPCNIIIDYKVKDIAEYIKISFFNKNYNIIYELDNYFKTNYLNYNSIILLYSRILYPTFYFHIYDNIIKEKTNNKELITLISKTKEYELFLYKIFQYIKKIYPIPEIDWIKKTNS